LGDYQPLSTDLKGLLRSDQIYSLLETQIIGNLKFLSTVVGNYKNQVNQFKIKFSDSDQDSSKKNMRVIKKRFKLRSKY
jgi:hypothetical protein